MSIRPTLRFHLFFAMLLMPFAIITGCNDDDDDDTPPSSPTPETIDFGASYYIVSNATSPVGDPLPVLAGDSLLIEVGHSGCSGDHEFEMRSRILNDNRAELWLYKITPDEGCAAAFSYELSYRVPFDVLSKEEIVFVGPIFDTYPLR